MTTPPSHAASPQAPSRFSVCVYCGSRMGASPAYADVARRVGRAIGERGWGLVYGGGNVGLMGVVADAALAAGALVVGVIPRTLMEREVGHQRLTVQHVVDTMHQRKQLMAEHANAFLALPGGIGTLEELYEVWTWRQLGYHRKPIGLLNTEGYYDPLLNFMRQTVDQGFLAAEQMQMVDVGTEPEALLARLHERATQASASQTADYRKI